MAKKGQTRRITSRQTSSQNKTPTWAWFLAGGIISVLLVIGLFYLGNQGINQTSSGIDGVEILADPGRGHVDGDIAYTQDIPVGGTHNPVWQNCGIYDEPVRKENAVHSLEHGAVWIAYQSDLPENQVETLRNLVRQERRNRGEAMVLLSPQPDIENPIVVTAWRVQLRLDDANDERLPDFLSAYQRGPFTPEPGAACTSGVGTPLS